MKDDVIKALDRALGEQTQSLEMPYVGELDENGRNLIVIDGTIDLSMLVDAVLAAVHDNLKPRLQFDEEGVLEMLKGGRGPLED
jgi:hypothetical protein